MVRLRLVLVGERADSIKLMELYYLSSLERRGKMKRLHQIYREKFGTHDVTFQNLSEQPRFIQDGAV